jgi:hypothetical protein
MNNITMTLIRCALTTFLAGISYYMLQIILSLEKRLDEIEKNLKENIENEKITIATLEKRLDEINKELKENIENEKRSSSKLNAFLDNYTIFDYSSYGDFYPKVNRIRLNKIGKINYNEGDHPIEISHLRLLKSTSTQIKFVLGVSFGYVEAYLSTFTGEFKYVEKFAKKMGHIPQIKLLNDYGEEYIVPFHLVLSILDAEIVSYDDFYVDKDLFKKSFDTFVDKHGGYEFGKLSNACDIDEVKLLFI